MDNKPKALKRKDIANSAMVAGNEDEFTEIILDGVVKKWVGIGWVEVRKATQEDYQKIREVVQGGN